MANFGKDDSVNRVAVRRKPVPSVHQHRDEVVCAAWICDARRTYKTESSAAVDLACQPDHVRPRGVDEVRRHAILEVEHHHRSAHFFEHRRDDPRIDAEPLTDCLRVETVPIEQPRCDARGVAQCLLGKLCVGSRRGQVCLLAEVTKRQLGTQRRGLLCGFLPMPLGRIAKRACRHSTSPSGCLIRVAVRLSGSTSTP